MAAISGQVGMDREGKIASGVRAQSEQVFRNIAACLEANGMRKEDLVKVTGLPHRREVPGRVPDGPIGSPG